MPVSKSCFNTKFQKTSLINSTQIIKKDNIPLRRPNLNIDGLTVDRQYSIKLLGVWIDGNLTWRDHVHTVKNKVAKNIGLLYQRKHYLDDKCLKQIYFSNVHTYLIYANIA